MKLIKADPEYKFCMLRAHKDHVCGGRITLEHALINAGRQVDEKFAIISVCAKGQEVDEYQDAHTMDKNLNRWVALNRATPQELYSLSKAMDYWREIVRLNRIYGHYRTDYYPPSVDFRHNLQINYPASMFSPEVYDY